MDFDINVRKRAIAFVDYEYWYYSFINNCNIRPDIRAWYDDMSENFDLIDTIFFGSFGQPDLMGEVPYIREITNNIVITDNCDGVHNKDMTDFIILDAIYQKSFEFESNPDIAYIIFTGDGHFQSVVKYLTMKRHADVTICYVRNTISHQLRSVATRTIEYFSDNCDIMRLCYSWIVRNFEYIQQNPHKNIIPTFNTVVSYVSNHNSCDENLIISALRQMIDVGYIARIEKQMDDRQVAILVPNWDKICLDNLITA